MRASIQEVAALFGFTRPTIRASLTVRREPAGFVGSVILVGEPGARVTCGAASDRVGHGPQLAVPIHLLVALGASSSYLSWATSGSPGPTFIGRVVRALDRSGDSREGTAFLSGGLARRAGHAGRP